MSDFNKMVRTDCKRAFQHPRFYLAILLFVISRLAVSMPEFTTILKQGQQEHILNQGYLYYSSFFLSSSVSGFAIVATCIPFAASYLEDRRTGFDLYTLQRTNIRNYSLSKMLVNLLASSAVAFCGFLLVSLIFGILTKGNPGALMGGEEMSRIGAISTQNPILYLILLSFLNALPCAFWSLFAQLISAMVRDIFLIIALTYVGQLTLMYLPLRSLGLMVLYGKTAFSGGWLASDTISFSVGLILNLVQFTFLYAVLFYLFERRVQADYKE